MSLAYPSMLPARTQVRLDRSYVIEASGCWSWTRNRTTAGYGHFHVGNRYLQAHRLMYVLRVGPIPDGLQLDHLCRNRACVNPDHLEPVTAAVNVRRGRSVRLTAEIVAAIRSAGDVSLRALAKQYGVHHTTVLRVLRDETWRPGLERRAA